MKENGYFHRVSAQTPTRIWINNVTPREARLAIAAGAVGCTQNPSYSYKMLTHPQGAGHSMSALDEILAGEGAQQPQSALQRALVTEIAGEFLPLFEKSGGKLGFVTIQGDPFREDMASILAAARSNHTAPNVMAKIPAIPEGLRAAEALLEERIPVLITEVMSVRQALDAAELYERHVKGGDSPALFFAHIPGIFDEYLAGEANRAGVDVPGDYLWQAGVAVAKKIGGLLREMGCKIGVVSGGARGPHHFTEMVGADCAVTINWGGTAQQLLEADPPVVSRFDAPVPSRVVDALLECLPDFRRAWEPSAITPGEYEGFGPVALFRQSFEAAWAQADEIIERRRRERED